MTVELRSHHFLCMLTFVGKGYSPGFTAAYERIVERINAGEDLRIVFGPDAICQALISEEKDPHCFRARINTRDSRAAADVARVLGREVTAGTSFELSPDDVRTLRKAFAQDAIRSACKTCQWSAICTDVARTEYAGAKLFPPRDAG